MNLGRGSRAPIACLLAATLVAACSRGESPQGTASPTETGSTGSAPTVSSSPTPEIVATPAARFLVEKFDVANPQGFAVGFGSVWVVGHRDGTISRIDPKTNEVSAVIPGIGYQAQDVVVGDGSVWVPASGANYVARIDPATNKIVSKLHVGAVSDVDFGFGSLWAATKDMQLFRIDPTTERVVARIQIGPKGPNDCNNGPVVTARWVWVSVCDTGMLMQVDLATNRIVRRIDIAKLFNVTSGQGLFASADALWVVLGTPSLIARLDPDTGKVVRRSTLDYSRVSPGGFMAVDQGTLWLGGDGILTEFDAKSLKILATYRVIGAGEADPGVGFGSVWAMIFDYSEVSRFDVPDTG